MPTWNKLHSATNESLAVADLIDRQPDAAILWFMMIAGAGAWGRFPAEPRKLARRVCGLSERLTGNIVSGLVKTLVAKGLLIAYADHKGAECLAISNYFEHNDSHAWHRLGPPEFGHPPNWIVPKKLREYFGKIAEDKFIGKKLAAECDKFMISPTDYSQGACLGTGLKAVPTVQSTEYREQQLENNKNGGGVLLEEGTSSGGEPNPERPSTDSLNPQNNDDTIIQQAFDMLVGIAKDDETNLRADIENAHKAYPEHILNAAIKTASQAHYKKNPTWKNIRAYFQSTVSGMAADAHEANSADPMRRPFITMFGTEPQGQPANVDWHDDLRKFRHWPQMFIRQKERVHGKDGGDYWPRLKAQAIEFGVWWEGVRPYLEAARQEKDEIERMPGASSAYQVEQIAEIDKQIAELEKEYADE